MADSNDIIDDPSYKDYSSDIEPDADPECPFPQPVEPPNSPIPNGPIPRGLVRQTVRYFVDSRRIAVRNNPQLITTFRWDQSDIFYNTRKMLDAKGYDVTDLSKENKRMKVYAYIKMYCDKLGIKRHEIGIFPADRAVMAYQGETYSIGYENYKKFARLGVDLICIEKEGIVEKLAPFTKNVGIALVQSRGFVSEYGILLAEEGKVTGANVMVLTDFDSDGIQIAFNIEGITRIGIDPTSIDEINAELKLETEDEDDLDADLEEEESVYKPNRENLEPEDVETLDPADLVEQRDENDNWISLDYLLKGLKRKDPDSSVRVPIEGTKHEKRYIKYLKQKYNFGNNIEETYVDFLKDRRIELNTIMNEIGAKRFWNWLYANVTETFPTRNYTRVIPVPPYEITLPVLDKLNNLVAIQIKECIQDEVNDIYSDLREVRGLLNTDVKIEEIDTNLNELVNNDREIKNLSKQLENVIESSFNIGDDDEET